MSALGDAGGAPEAFLAVNRDLTEREALAAALHRSHRLYRSVLEAMPAGVVLRDAEGRYEALNAAAEEILGVDADELVGRRADAAPWRLVDEDGAVLAPHEHPAAVAVREGRAVARAPLGVWRADGTVRWVVSHSVPLAEVPGAASYAVLTTLADVTDGKRRTDELREREGRLKDVLEASADGYVDYDLATGRVVCSTRAAEILGLDAPPRTIDEVLVHVAAGDRARIDQARADHLAGRTAQVDLEYRVRMPERETRWVRVRAKAVASRIDGGPLRLVGTITDVTARHRLQLSLMTAIAGRNRVVEQLQDALAQVKTLRGLLPVCAWCNKIEVEHGWQRIESYIAERTHAKVSHGSARTASPA